MVTYQILYWQEVPVQIKVAGDEDEVSLPLDPRFMEHVDHLAAQRGLQDTDNYLAQWQWSDEEQCDGESALAIAEALKAELEAQASW